MKWSYVPQETWLSIIFGAGPVALVMASYAICRAWPASKFEEKLVPLISWIGMAYLSLGLITRGWRGNPLHNWMYDQPWQHGVAFATIDYHGNAGTWIAISGIWITLWLMTKPIRFWRLGGILIALIAATVNASRTAMLLTPVAMLMTALATFWLSRSKVTYLQYSRPWTAVAVVVPTLVIAAGVAWFLQSQAGESRTATQRFLVLNEEASKPWYPRRMELHSLEDLVPYRPLTGYGPGAYPSAVADLTRISGYFFAPAQQPGQTPQAIAHATCDIAETVVEFGIPMTIWLAAPMLVAGGLLSIAVFRRKYDPVTGRYAVAVLMTIAVIVLHGLVDCTLQLPVTTTLMALMIGIGLARVFRQVDETTDSQDYLDSPSLER